MRPLAVIQDDSMSGLIETLRQPMRQPARLPGMAPRWRWGRRFLRFGYVARGITYLLPGMLALRLAIGGHGSAVTASGAIERIGQQPFGRVLLVPVAIGLMNYALWGAIRSIFDPLRKGHSAAGVIWRAGFALSAVVYAGLAVATIRYLFSAPMHVISNEDWTKSLLARPFGPWLVGGLGLVGIAGGLAQLVSAWRGMFAGDLDLGGVSHSERRWAMALGRVGIAARGVVFAIIGGFLVSAALDSDPRKARGMDGALLQLAREPHGTALLAITSIGLIVFGLFSILCTRWARMSVDCSLPRARPKSATLT